MQLENSIVSFRNMNIEKYVPLLLVLCDLEQEEHVLHVPTSADMTLNGRLLLIKQHYFVCLFILSVKFVLMRHDYTHIRHQDPHRPQYSLLKTLNQCT